MSWTRRCWIGSAAGGRAGNVVPGPQCSVRQSCRELRRGAEQGGQRTGADPWGSACGLALDPLSVSVSRSRARCPGLSLLGRIAGEWMTRADRDIVFVSRGTKRAPPEFWCLRRGLPIKTRPRESPHVRPHWILQPQSRQPQGSQAQGRHAQDRQPQAQPNRPTWGRVSPRGGKGITRRAKGTAPGHRCTSPCGRVVLRPNLAPAQNACGRL